MGFMTEVSILNDRWDEIRRNPKEFVETLYMHSIGGDQYSRWIIGQTTATPSHHADDIRVYFAGRNSFFDAYPWKDRYQDLESLKRHLGYIKEMRGYLKISEDATKEAIAKGEGK